MGWDKAQDYWRDKFSEAGFVGVKITHGVYYLRQRERGEMILLSEESVAPSKLAWLIQQGFAEGVLAGVTPPPEEET